MSLIRGIVVTIVRVLNGYNVYSFFFSGNHTLNNPFPIELLKNLINSIIRMDFKAKKKI